MIECFNFQLGLYRGLYEDLGIGDLFVYKGVVNGFVFDSINILFISGGYDGVLKVWDFKNLVLKFILFVELLVEKIVVYCGNGLIVVVVYDKVF